jgi:hypothetical protein
MSPLRTTLAVVSSAALLATLPAGAVAQSPGDYPTSGEPTSSQVHKKGKKKRAHRKLSDAQLTRVAEALDTTLAALKEAMSEVGAAVKASEERETKAQREAMLAERLGVSAADVRAAFASVAKSGPRRGSGRGAKRGGGCRKPAPTSDTDPGTYPGDSTGTYPGDSAGA